MQYVCHAEMNAILNKNAESLLNCTVRTHCLASPVTSSATISHSYRTSWCIVTVVLFVCGAFALTQLYVALFPCNECAKLIIQSGINEVVYLSDKYHTTCVMITEAVVAQRLGVDVGDD